MDDEVNEAAMESQVGLTKLKAKQLRPESQAIPRKHSVYGLIGQ
jgi:hypothetical protein